MEKRIMWLVGGRAVTPAGIIDAAVGVDGSRVVAVAPKPGVGKRIAVRGCVVAPGLIDLHIWGDPAVVAREAVKTGTTAFLTAIGPCEPECLVGRLAALDLEPGGIGARCLGAHLEGPFVNPTMGGALPRRWMRPIDRAELRQLAPLADRIKLITLAPELPGAMAAIAWAKTRGIATSLGHSDADAATVAKAVDRGAALVTHVFNGMKPFHHRQLGLLSTALLDPRLTTMVILDGVHVGWHAFDLLLRTKGPAGIILVTDSIRHGRPMDAIERGGAFYTPSGVLAGSALTMIGAVQRAVSSGKITLDDALRMASAAPARVLGQAGRRGRLAAGAVADLVVFDSQFRVRLTLVGGRIVYTR